AYLTLIFCDLEPRSCGAPLLAEAHATLADFPTEKRKVAPAPELAQLPRRWLPSRHWEPLARDLVPMRLRPASSFEWKSSPYRLQLGPPQPYREYTGLDYLVAYWLYAEVCSTRTDCPAAE